jgi:ABC-2 type transport system permease protein
VTGIVATGLGESWATEFRRIHAYVKKEFLLQLSYRFSVLFWVLGVFTTITTYFFIDRLFGRQMTPELAAFGAPYFAYVLVGNAFFAYVGTAISGLSGRISEEQSLGTLEVLLGTPTSLWVFIVAIAGWNVAYASVEVLLYFVLGAVGFGVDFSQTNWLSLAVVLGLVIVAFNGLGLFEAGCLIVFQRGALGAWVLNGLSAVLGGVFFPVTVLPDWLQPLVEINPITHAVRALQRAIFQHVSVGMLASELAVLVIFAALLVPAGIVIWRWALRRARLEGTLCLH